MSDGARLLVISGAIFLTGATSYWQLHPEGPFRAVFWISLILSSVGPVGTYLLGLFQEKPFKGDKP